MKKLILFTFAALLPLVSYAAPVTTAAPKVVAPQIEKVFWRHGHWFPDPPPVYFGPPPIYVPPPVYIAPPPPAVVVVPVPAPPPVYICGVALNGVPLFCPADYQPTTRLDCGGGHIYACPPGSVTSRSFPGTGLSGPTLYCEDDYLKPLPPITCGNEI